MATAIKLPFVKTELWQLALYGLRGANELPYVLNQKYNLVLPFVCVDSICARCPRFGCNALCVLYAKIIYILLKFITIKLVIVEEAQLLFLTASHIIVEIHKQENFELYFVKTYTLRYVR